MNKTSCGFWAAFPVEQIEGSYNWANESHTVYASPLIWEIYNFCPTVSTSRQPTTREVGIGSNGQDFLADLRMSAETSFTEGGWKEWKACAASTFWSGGSALRALGLMSTASISKRILSFERKNRRCHWLIIKQLLNSAFVSYEELWRSRRVLSVDAVTPSSISIILHIRYSASFINC